MQRVEGLVRTTLAELLLTEVKDERLRLASVTHVKVSKDLRHAVIAISSVDTDPNAMQPLLEGLEHAKGWLRRELGNRIQLKCTPDLRFVPDTSAAYAARIQEVLRDVLPEQRPEENHEENSEDSDEDTPQDLSRE
jgi:ribosome-binding factor A